jgi:prolyl oligopeptidase
MTVLRYPDAPRLDLVEDLPPDRPRFRVADPYRWLEDPAREQTQAWARAQDELTAAELGALPGRDRLREQVRRLLGAGMVSAPAWRRERQFFQRRTAEQEHAVLLTVDPDSHRDGDPDGAGGGRDPDGAGRERVLIDPMAIDSSGTTTLDAWQPSKEGELLAYQLSQGGTEESVLYVMDVRTGQVVDGPIDRARYSPVAWLPGGEAFYYVRRIAPELVPVDETQYHRRVWLHRLGTDPAGDTLVFGDGMDKTNYYGVSVSMDGRWLVISASAGTAPRNDAWLADLSTRDPAAPDLQAVQRDVDAQTSVHVGRDGVVYLFTDRDARRGRLAVATPEDVTGIGYAAWKDLVPEDPEAVLEDYAILDGPELADPVLLCGWTRHAVSEVSVHDLRSGRRTGSVPLPGLGSVAGISERPEGGHEAWLGYTDPTTPASVFRYDARTGSTELWAQAPGTVDVPGVSSRQMAYPSADGTTVRMLVLSSGDDGDRPAQPRPAILYGYGGFGLSLTPGYSASVLAWLEAGGVYAIAGLRGGGEEGEDWHRAGMLHQKQNVFDDFFAAAEELVRQGWTTSDRLAVSGGSNGGLLVGAALTQRPELFNAAVCSAPLLDMVRYERFGLGATWAEEYGTAADADSLAWLLAYSPYHAVREGVDYPATLFTVFDGDTRVDPMHARKMCAALQHATSGQRPVLLRREQHVGHGARALSRTIELAVDTLAFTARWTGLAL